MRRPRVLVLGDVMRDIVVRPQGPLRRGTDQRAAIRTRPGGAGANQAAWLAFCDVEARLVACVGRDDLGIEAAALRARGVVPRLVGHETCPTGQLIAIVDADGERSFLTDRGANDGLRRGDLPADVLDGIDHLHVSGYALVGGDTRETALGLLRDAKTAGIPVSLDPGSAGFIAELGPAAMLEAMEGAFLCAANADEAAALTGARTLDAQGAALAARVELVLLKQGPAGATACHRDGRRWHAAAPRVAVVDTIGAGDAFLAGFLAATLAGAEIGPALQRAVDLGAFAVQRPGAAPP